MGSGGGVGWVGREERVIGKGGELVKVPRYV